MTSLKVHSLMVNPDKPEDLADMLNIIEHSEKIITIFPVTDTGLTFMDRVFVISRQKEA